MILLSENHFQFGKKDEKLFKEFVDTYMSVDINININKRNNLLSQIKLSLRKNRSIYNE